MTNGPVELLVVRHGESMGNVAAAVAHGGDAEVIEVGQRDADVPLSPVGREPGAGLGAGLRALLADDRADPVVWSSPYVRAPSRPRDLAVAAAGEQRSPIDERLRDRELGVLDLLTTRGVANRYPERGRAAAVVGQVLPPPARWRVLGGRRPPGPELRARPRAVPDGTRALVVATTRWC